MSGLLVARRGSLNQRRAAGAPAAGGIAFDFTLESVGAVSAFSTPVGSVSIVEDTALSLNGLSTTGRATWVWDDSAESDVDEFEVVVVCRHTEDDATTQRRQGVATFDGSNVQRGFIRQGVDTIAAVSGIATSGSDDTPTFASNLRAAARIRVDPAAPEQRGRIWQFGQPEPSDWQLISTFTWASGDVKAGGINRRSAASTFWYWIGVSYDPQDHPAPLPGQVAPVNA